MKFVDFLAAAAHVSEEDRAVEKIAERADEFVRAYYGDDSELDRALEDLLSACLQYRVLCSDEEAA